MTEKVNPPPYSGTTQGLDQSMQSMQNPAGAQTNYGYNNQQQQYQGYAPQPQGQGYAPQQQGQFVGQQQQTMNNVVVAQVGGGGGNIYQAAPVDYTTQAWIACLCCFWPTGLVAILKSSESRDCLARGDLMGAQSAAATARTMVRISFVVGIVSLVLAVVLIGVMFGVVYNSTAQCCVNGDCYNC